MLYGYNQGMDADALTERLLAGEEPEQIVDGVSAETIATISEQLKRKFLYFQYRDAQQAWSVIETMHRFAQAANDRFAEALALQTEGMYHTTITRDYDKAIAAYEPSFTLLKTLNDDATIAVGHVLYIWALACQQRFDEALSAGEWARNTLIKAHDQTSVAVISNNLGAIYGRRGDDVRALEQFQYAEQAYRALGQEGEQRLPFAMMNQAIVLRNLGRFDEAQRVNQQALMLARQYEQTATAARIQQNMGLTFFVLGRFNRAYALLDQARDTFLADGRTRDAILVDLFISDGLLQLGRYAEVIEKCEVVQTTFAQLGVGFEVAQAQRNRGVALIGLQRYAEAEETLREAERLFSAENNPIWRAYCQLDRATLALLQEQPAQALALTERPIEQFAAAQLTTKHGEAQLIAARANAASGNFTTAQNLLSKIQAAAHTQQLPSLRLSLHQLRGEIALEQEQHAVALAVFESAIQELETMQSQMMVEYRADFLQDKQQVYEQAVGLCLMAGNPTVALNYVERAKSRALLALVANRIDLGVRALRPEDEPLVAQLDALRLECGRLHRRWITGEIPDAETAKSAEQLTEQLSRQAMRQRMSTVERELRQNWHRLLVRNAAYSRDASNWQVQTDLDHSQLGSDSVILNYFVKGGEIVVFVISADSDNSGQSESIRAHTLSTSITTIAQLDQRLRHNFQALQRAPQLAAQLTRKAQNLLRQLYQALIEPIVDHLAPFQNLIFTPHNALHYLPLHALFDGTSYLLERFTIRYLPGSSFLNLTPNLATTDQCLILSSGDDLAHLRSEVDAIATVLSQRAAVAIETTRAHYLQQASDARLIHIAAHGLFRDDDPLFSGIALADGTLTTLDIFNTPLQASLVTLSACDTGRHVIGGGDELFGLMRSFLSAGAASLLLTLWRVEDEISAEIMRHFYNELLTGKSKAEALRAAQLTQLDHHPFFWSPFFLVGDGGIL